MKMKQTQPNFIEAQAKALEIFAWVSGYKNDYPGEVTIEPPQEVQSGPDAGTFIITINQIRYKRHLTMHVRLTRQPNWLNKLFGTRVRWRVAGDRTSYSEAYLPLK